MEVRRAHRWQSEALQRIHTPAEDKDMRESAGKGALGGGRLAPLKRQKNGPGPEEEED